jgi:hypothetical protein
MNENKKAVLNVLPHVLIWSVLFAFPFLFNPSDSQFSERMLIKSMIPLLFSAFIFYLNYFYLIDEFLFKEKIGMFLFLNIVVIGACLYSFELSRHLLPHSDEFRKMVEERKNWPRPKHGGPNKWLGVFRTTLSFLLTSGVSVAIRSTQQWMKTVAEKKNMENERLLSELAHLQYQLQPHFFFNALNNIYSLMDSSPAKAKESIHGLAKLMRYILYETRDEKISLAKEMEFLQNCIRLMKLRITDLVSLEVKFPENVENLQISPLLLIPLVENAFKHGVSAIVPTRIFIQMTMEEKTLYFKTENTLLKKPQTDHSISGIGIPNLEKRLELLYPGRFEFKKEIIQDPDKITGELYCTTLKIQL